MPCIDIPRFLDLQHNMDNMLNKTSVAPKPNPSAHDLLDDVRTTKEEPQEVTRCLVTSRNMKT